MIQKANRDLEATIQEQGPAAVIIDNSLLQSDECEDEQSEVGSDDDEAAIVNNGSSGAAILPEESDASSKDSRTVQLEFALGDFDGTAIAALEDSKADEVPAASSS